MSTAAESKETLDNLVKDVSAFTLLLSSGGDKLTAFEHAPFAEFSITSLLMQEKYLERVQEGMFVGCFEEFEPDESCEPSAGPWGQELAQSWETQLSALESQCEKIEVWRLTNRGEANSFDDQFHILVGRVSDEVWWAMGPKLTTRREWNGRGKGDELPAPPHGPDRPEWLEPVIRLRNLVMIGQEECLTGDNASWESTPSSSNVLEMSTSKEGAIERYLRSSSFLSAHALVPFEDPAETHQEGSAYAREKPRIMELDQFMANLSDPRVYVLGNWANYTHFAAGKCEDGGWAGFRTTAGWC